MKETFGERHHFKQFLTQLSIFKGENKIPILLRIFFKKGLQLKSKVKLK
jgi:hypothetical protein